MNPNVIGFVSYGGGTILAELLGKDKWRVTAAGKDDPATARALTELYRDTYAGPSDGYYGQAILQDLAQQTGGAYAYNAPPPAPPDTVF